ncbi:MAG: c-type cytochrome biogenesis protein CcmI, partial [Gammaproteobacteria bacterium]|nr:c-type cytochrome biogenesis protein CcmI [Gammaproteobacteria bacterium]
MIEAWPWLIPAALALAAVVTAALRLSRSARERRRDTNLALYRQRRRELAAEAEDALQEELQTELQARLLEDEAGESGAPANPAPATRIRLGTAAIFSLAARVAAVAIYANIGEPEAPALAKAGTLLRYT